MTASTTLAGTPLAQNSRANPRDDFPIEKLVPGFRAPARPEASPDAATLRATERAAREWTSPAHGPLDPAADAFAPALREMFFSTFNPYRPAVIAWPKLSPQEQERITSLPIWDIAVQTEGRARLYIACYAATLKDPAMREAMALNAWEEDRHKDVLRRLVEAYGVALVEEPPYAAPKNPEWAYLVTGYSECVDSFFAFGLFETARRSGLFPPELVETFEPVMQEECRHILLFANWLAWHRARLGFFARLRFELEVLRVWVFLAMERVGLARSMEGDKTKDDSHFAMTGASSVSSDPFDLRSLLTLCLSENERRFAGYDPRLKRPRTAPRLAALALKLLGKPKSRNGD